MGLPSITIAFKKEATTANIRSQRGVVGLVLIDENVPAVNPLVITSVLDIPKTISAANRAQIMLALIGYKQATKKVVCYYDAPTHTEYTYTEVSNPKKRDNPSSKGWYVVSEGEYSGTTDTSPVSGSTYYAIAEVTPEGSENPSTAGWLERSGSEGAYTYAASSDETVGDKTYYAAEAVTPEMGDNPSTEGWYEMGDITYIPSTDTQVNSEDTYYTQESETVDAPDITDALEYFHTSDVNYLAMPEAETYGLTADIVTWVKAIHANDDDNNAVVAVLPNAGAANTEYVINYTIPSVTDTNDVTYTAEQYCSRLAGLFASIPLTESATYVELEELTECTKYTRAEINAKIDAGQFVVFDDGEKIKTGRAVNSLTSSTKGDEYKKIKVVDAMLLIRADIARTSEDYYIGRYPNSYDNKMLLVTAIRTYFDSLTTAGALRAGSTCDVDKDANKAYLIEKGVDVSGYTDIDLLKANTGSEVFLAATISILDAIEDITLVITI